MARGGSGPDLRGRVAAFIDRHGLLPAGPVVVALSGGPDSLLLLHLLADLAPGRGWRLAAAHLDHGLRPEAAVEVETVRALAAARGIALESERADVAALARARGWGIEEAGRIARYRFLARVAATLGGAPVATGHTQDDQAETLLLRLARGTGLAGLRAMRPATLLPPSVWHGAAAAPPLRVVRPLLGTSRDEIERELATRGLTPLRDPSNAGAAYARNRIRHELLPAWQGFDAGIAARLARAADIAAADEEILERETERAWSLLAPRLEQPAAGRVVRSVTLARDAFLEQPLALRRRLLRRAIALCAPEEPTYAALDLALDLVSAGAGAADVTGGVRVGARGDRVVVERREAATRPPPRAGEPSMEPGAQMALAGAGSGLLPGGAWTILCRRLDAHACTVPLSGRHAHFRPELVTAGPVVRTWRPGDRIALPGLGGHKKLSDLFIDRKVPRAERAQVPLVAADDGTIAWIVGLAVGEPWRARGDETVVLCCTIRPATSWQGAAITR